MLHNSHNAHRPAHRLTLLILQLTPIQQTFRPLIQPLLRVSQSHHLDNGMSFVVPEMETCAFRERGEVEAVGGDVLS